MPLPAIITLLDHHNAGLVVTSHCSADASHTRVLDIPAMLAGHGDRPLDHEFKLSLVCAICGAPGGGVEIAQKAA